MHTGAAVLSSLIPLQTTYSTDLPAFCLGPLPPRGAIWSRHELSPHLPVVCHGLCLCEGFAGPLRDVVNPLLFRHTPYSLAFDYSRSITLVRPSDLVTGLYHFSSRRFTATVARIYSYGHNMLCDGFPDMLVSDMVFVGDAKELS